MNLAQVEKLLHDLYLLTDMQIALCDKQFHPIAGSSIPNKDFCSAVHSTPRGLSQCLRSDLAAFAEAKRTKKTVIISACPFGLFDVVTPLLDGDEILGFLFAGGALPRDEKKKAEALQRALPFVPSKMREQELVALIEALPSRTEQEFEAFSEALRIFGEYIVNSGFFDNDRKSLAELIKGYINHNFQSKITLSELSLCFHCSTVTLTETFRKEFGITIMQYVTEKRLEVAERLLEQRELGIGTIAEECGFGGIEYFSKVFKKKHGISPTLWRRELPPA
jgi:AraC-like DNA-binding protein/ligand-binding sensor protein